MCKIVVHTIVNEILQSCTYFLTREGEDRAYLIDCGDPAPIISYLEKKNKSLQGVFLTHSHYDHIYGLNEIIEKYPDLEVYASENTFLGLADSDLNMSYLYTDEDFVVRVSKEHSFVVDEKSNKIILGETVKCMATPGHDVDCMTYLIGNMLFTGDSYNPNSPVFTKWRNSDVDLALRNEAMLSQIVAEKMLIVYPGHSIEA